MRYHGGKWMLAPWIVDQLPPHAVYVEPFAGAASVLLRKPRSRIEVLNDRYDRIVNVYRVLRDPAQAERLKDLLRLTPCSEVEYHLARDVAADPVEDARRMLVLGQQGHGSTGASGGKLTGWRRGVRQQGPASADEWSDLFEHVASWADRLRGVYLEHADYRTVIERWDGPETVFYVDPPYLPETRVNGLRGYAHEMSEADHRELGQLLNQVQGYVILSGYASALYDLELYRGWRRMERKVVADRAKPATEVLWISPNARQRQMPLFA